MPVKLDLDFQCQLLDAPHNQELQLTLQYGDETQTVALKPASRTGQPGNLAWSALGLRLAPASSDEMRDRHPNYQRGLKILEVRPGSSADAEGIIEGDILVAMHGWKTESLENLAYILENTNARKQKEFMFYILRDKEPFWGRMRIASADSH